VNTDKLIVFFATWASVSVLILIFSALSWSNVVLGNGDVEGSMSAVALGFLFCIVSANSAKILKNTGLMIKDERFGILFCAGIITPLIWIIKKFAIYTGLGISNNIFVLILAIVVATGAYCGFKYFDFYLKKIQ